MTNRRFADTSVVVSGVRTWRLTPTLPLPWRPGVNRLHIVVTEITTTDGRVGTGFTWTVTRGTGAIEATIRDDLIPYATGQRVTALSWERMAAHLREVGSGGVVALALAGLDLALWDLAGQLAETSVAQLLGATTDVCPAYSSGINWHYSTDQLIAQVQRWVDAGAESVKVKVGPPRTTAEDHDRLRAVRRVLGPERRLMIDANQRWSSHEASAAIDRLQELDLAWVEEPLDADDLEGYRNLCSRVAVPVAAGENLSRVAEFEAAIAAGVAIVQPNVCRIGGITPFLRVAELARSAGARIAPHLLPEVSAQLAVAVGDTCVEVPDGARFCDLGVLDHQPPITVEGASVVVHSTPGLGLRFRPPAPSDQPGDSP